MRNLPGSACAVYTIYAQLRIPVLFNILKYRVFLCIEPLDGRFFRMYKFKRSTWTTDFFPIYGTLLINFRKVILPLSHKKDPTLIY